jgi:hypothetical protein
MLWWCFSVLGGAGEDGGGTRAPERAPLPRDAWAGPQDRAARTPSPAILGRPVDAGRPPPRAPEARPAAGAGRPSGGDGPRERAARTVKGNGACGEEPLRHAAAAVPDMRRRPSQTIFLPGLKSIPGSRARRILRENPPSPGRPPSPSARPSPALCRARRKAPPGAATRSRRPRPPWPPPARTPPGPVGRIGWWDGGCRPPRGRRRPPPRCRAASAAAASTISRIRERGAVASSSIIAGLSRARDGSAARRASQMRSLSARSRAARSDRAAARRLTAAASAVSASTPSALPPSASTRRIAPASAGRPAGRLASTAWMHLRSRDSSVQGRMRAAMTSETASAASRKPPKGASRPGGRRGSAG